MTSSVDTDLFEALSGLYDDFDSLIAVDGLYFFFSGFSLTFICGKSDSFLTAFFFFFLPEEWESLLWDLERDFLLLSAGV